MIAALIVMSVLGSTAECVKSSRDEPTVMIENSGKHYFIHLLVGEEKLCEQLASEFNAGKLSRVCGCKHLQFTDDRDLVRLRCAHVIKQRIVSRTVGVYYYYDDDSSVPACKKTRDKLMKDGRRTNKSSP